MNLKLKPLCNTNNLKDIITDWLKLYDTEDKWLNPFCNPAFVMAYHDSIGMIEENNLLVLAAFENYKLVAIIPLQISSIKKEISIVGGELFADYHDWLILGIEPKIIIKLIIRYLSNCYPKFKLKMNRIKSEKFFLSFIEANKNSLKFSLAEDQSHYIDLRNFNNKESVLKLIGGKKFYYDTVRSLKNLKKYTEKLIFINDFNQTNCETSEIVDFIINETKKRYIRKKAPDLTSIPGYSNFIYELLTLGFEYNFINLCSLKADDRIISAHFGFISQNKIFWYLPAYNLKYAKFSPGRLLLLDAIDSCIRNHTNEIDLTWGNDSYKYKWKTDSNLLFNIEMKIK